MSEQLVAALCCGLMFLGALMLAGLIDWIGKQSRPPTKEEENQRDPDAHHNGVDWDFWETFQRERMTQGPDGVWRLRRGTRRKKAG